MRNDVRSRIGLGVAALVSLLLAVAAPAADETAARIARVENGLLPPTRVVGVKASPWTLVARMAAHHVPGVAIAVVDGGTIAWTRGYGIARAGETAAVTPDTLFQAAELSQPVAAAAALALVDAGKLALDDDVNAKLTSWKIPSAAIAAGEPVTLRRLLGHAAGLTVPGLAGYASDEKIPTLPNVLDGAPPARSAPIRIEVKPGTRWRYAGGSYCVLQQLLSDVTGEAFPALMQERVLAPAHMDASTFAQPLPADLAARAAAGHRATGERTAGDARVYPEMAAAGLWSTPADLARFALALQQALRGESGMLSRAMAEAMIAPVLPGSDYGLGIGVKGSGDNLQLSLTGANAGFRCMLVSYPRLGRGAVVMTNSDNGGPLVLEIVRAIATEYGWPDYRAVEKHAIRVPPETLERFAGRYEREGHTLRFGKSRSGKFFVSRDGAKPVEIFAESENEFFLLEEPETYVFERDASGNVTHLVVRTSPPEIYLPARQ